MTEGVYPREAFVGGAIGSKLNIRRKPMTEWWRRDFRSADRLDFKEMESTSRHGKIREREWKQPRKAWFKLRRE